MDALTPDSLINVLSSFTSEDLAYLCAAMRLPTGGSKDERLHRLSQVRISPAELLANFTTAALSEACECLDLKTGRKAAMIAALLGHAPTLASQRTAPPVEILEPSRENVLRVLQDIHVPRRSLQTENQVEEFLHSVLAPHFQTVATQYFTGGHLGTKIDIDIAGRVGVEIKLAANLARATDVHRFMGQALHYRQRYGSDLVIVIAGLTSDIGSPLLLDMRDLLATLGVAVVFLSAL